MNDRTRLKIAWGCISALAILSLITLKLLIITFGAIETLIPCALITVAGLMVGEVLNKNK